MDKLGRKFLNARRTKKSVGLLGGTFDPPHNGHSRISMLALKHFKLDEVWWIVSLLNPLKNEKTISSFDFRVNEAKKISRNSNIIISSVEKDIKTPYTIDVLDYLTFKHPKISFVWLLGVDNLEKMHDWKDWRKIFCKVPIAIFDRPSYSLNIIKSKSICFFKNKRIKKMQSRKLKYANPPSWVFYYDWGCNNSSTSIKSKSKT